MSLTKFRNKNARPLELPAYNSLIHMATETGIPLAVLKGASKAGCPFIKHNRPDLLAFLKWYFSRDMSEEETENWATRDKRAVALIREAKLEEVRHESIQFSTVDFYLGELVNTIFFGELERLCQEFPPALKGRTEIEIKDECEKQRAKIKKQLTARLEAWKALGPKGDA